MNIVCFSRFYVKKHANAINKSGPCFSPARNVAHYLFCFFQNYTPLMLSSRHILFTGRNFTALPQDQPTGRALAGFFQLAAGKVAYLHTYARILLPSETHFLVAEIS